MTTAATTKKPWVAFNGYTTKHDLRKLEDSIESMNRSLLEIAKQEPIVKKMNLKGETDSLQEALRWMNTALNLAKERMKDAIQKNVKEFGPIGATCHHCREEIYGYQDWELENPNDAKVHSKCWEKVYPRYVD